jgi:outer membrane immunogenic protein
MKRFLVAGIAAGAFLSAPALATPPAPMFNWTGWYGGLNAGAVWGDADIDWLAVPGGGGFSALGAASLNANGPGNIRKTGFTGGGQFGYSYQIQNFVWGLEGDIGYTDLRGTRTVTNIPVFVAPNSITESFESGWLATVRGRLGVTTGPWLLYGTGGLAVAQMKFSDNFTDPVGGVSASSTGKTRAGWAVGGGAEWAYSAQWSMKIEYLHADLGHTRDSSAATLIPPAAIFHDHKLTEDIVRVGMNYKFGSR